MKTGKIMLGLVLVVAVALGLVFASPLGDAKSNNEAGAGQLAWAFSSLPDANASNLMLNRPNGNVAAILNGSMRGLVADTNYAVYLSNQWTNLAVWPGLFSNSIPAFAFGTNKQGTGNWHLNVPNAQFGYGYSFPTFTLSIWIAPWAPGAAPQNPELISENFTVTANK
jgi:hypothetical protein